MPSKPALAWGCVPACGIELHCDFILEVLCFFLLFGLCLFIFETGSLSLCVLGCPGVRERTEQKQNRTEENKTKQKGIESVAWPGGRRNIPFGLV